MNDSERNSGFGWWSLLIFLSLGGALELASLFIFYCIDRHNYGPAPREIRHAVPGDRT